MKQNSVARGWEDGYVVVSVSVAAADAAGTARV